MRGKPHKENEANQSSQLEKSQKRKKQQKKASSTNTFQYIFIRKKGESSMWKWEFFYNPHVHVSVFPFL